MESEKELTGQESLELIATMISRTKADYIDTGISALLWGSIITICSLVTFFNVIYWKIDWLGAIWFLTFAAIIPQVIISRRERKQRKFKGHHDDLVGGIWISYAVGVSMLSVIINFYVITQVNTMFLILYGMPTFGMGYARQFKPMIFGGIACWIFAVLNLFAPWPYQILYNAAAAQLAWFIPGLILRRRYLNAKKKHV